MPSSIETTFFGPMTKDYCSLFLALSSIGLIYIVLAIFGIIGIIVSKKGTRTTYIGLALGLATGTVIYIQNRLLYNICLSK